MDTIRDMVIQLAAEHWQLIALAAIGVAALGMLFGLLKRLVASLFLASIKAGEGATNAVLSRQGLRVSVPTALAAILFGSGWLLGASKPPRIEYVKQPPEIVTRDVVKEVVKEVKVPTFIEKIIEVPQRIVTPAKPAPNAKCYYCAALLNVDNVPKPTWKDDPRMFRCGGCDGQIFYEHARVCYRFKRNDSLFSKEPEPGEKVDLYMAEALGRDPIPEPKQPPAGADKAAQEKYEKAVALWKKQVARFIDRQGGN